MASPVEGGCGADGRAVGGKADPMRHLTELELSSRPRTVRVGRPRIARCDRFASLFAEHGVLVTAGRADGREQIRRRMDGRDRSLRSRHVLTNILIDVTDKTNATGVTYLTLYRHIGPESLDSDPVEFSAPAAVGHYDDVFTRIDGQWLFASRSVSFALRRSSAFPADF